MKKWEELVRKVVPYVPGEQPDQPDMIKLNTNENPYPPAPGVERALKAMDTDALRLYPDPTSFDLVDAIAKHYQVSPDRIFVGVGSDDVLAMAFLTFFNGDNPILFPDITYSFYDVWANVFRIPYRQMPLNEKFEMIPSDYYSGNTRNGGIIFPNPNAPTGVELPQESIESILQNNPDVVVIVDEAYVDFGAHSALPLIDKYDNLLVVQTFSKSRSMAGMRIGYAFGSEKLIAYLNDVKYSFNSYTMNRTALLLGVEAVKDETYFNETLEKITRTREWVKEELKKLGFVFEDSKTNFVFAAHKTVQAREIYEALKEAHIYVRYFQKPRIDNYLRITIGTREEMEKLLSFLNELLNEKI